MLFCCLWHNVEPYCHKHFAVLFRHQQTPPLTTSEVSQLTDRVVFMVRLRHIYNTWLVAELTVHIEARYWLRIAISAYSICIRHRH